MLIEVRIGPGKRKLKHIISKIKHECNISYSKIHRVPHITLYGSFSANRSQVRKIKKTLLSVGKRYSSYFSYLIDGFGYMEGKKGKVVFFDVVPSEGFKKFRKELAKNLLEIVPDTQPWDKKDKDFNFHSTLAYKLTNREFSRIWSYVSQNKSLIQRIKSFFKSNGNKAEGNRVEGFYLPLPALRITFLNNKSKIICEYDFLQKRLLSRREALNGKQWRKTFHMYRVREGIQINDKNDNSGPYVISDLHLDHSNIIHYCARPFTYSNVGGMNKILLKNWNNIVGEDEEVYYLGDLSFGRPESYWLKRLNGNIHFIRGAHDKPVEDSRENLTLEYKGYDFFLTHKPEDVPDDWDGWIIHGHKHNNDLRNYPFINGRNKTINVSVETVNYKPVSLDYLTSLDLESIERMDKVNSEPEKA